RHLSQWRLADFFAHMHPDDLPAIQQCVQFMGAYSTSDPEEHRFTIHVRLRSNAGEYNHIKFEHIAIRIPNASYIHLVLFSDISREEKFHHIKLDVFKAMNGNFIRIYTYNPQQKDRDITPRQHDIARLVTKGFTNREIADQLGVSVYTVKNHKQMLFKKVNVRSSVELANYVKEAAVV
ncbi:MAG TPA: LuxR C-terminal-related transcriptional regulator, partial [Chryseolinea sp.]|nr:LuxR C-terminal-related transcriptional regulator [Chryseolinea sp.]